MSCVVDAAALLAFLLAERGGAEMPELLAGAIVSAVNYQEVLARLHDLKGKHGASHVAAARVGLERLRPSFRSMPFDEEAARVTADLRPETREVGLGVGDRACLAQGRISGLPILTADSKWAGLDLGLDVRLIR